MISRRQKKGYTKLMSVLALKKPQPAQGISGIGIMIDYRDIFVYR
jgi:hypothetical protein